MIFQHSLQCHVRRPLGHKFGQIKGQIYRKTIMNMFRQKNRQMDGQTIDLWDLLHRYVSKKISSDARIVFEVLNYNRGLRQF